jgi:hypothetical protein
MGLITNSGNLPSLRGQPSNHFPVPAGGTFIVTGEQGWYCIRTGKYSTFQQFDPILQAWVGVGGGLPGSGTALYVYLDGSTSYRFANQTGCAVGALLTNAGSGYTSAPTVTASAGNSIWRAVVGGLVNTSPTIVNAGQNYTYPPQILIAAPPPGGIQATAICAISAGAISSVTVTNQGGGYASPPTVTVVNDPREKINGLTPGYGGAIVTSLTGAKTIAGVICIDHGTPLTAVPTLTFTGGGGASAAATAIMCWSITAFTPTAGTGFTGPSELSGLDAFPQTSPAYTNPATQSGLVSIRKASILMPASAGAPTATGAVFYDGGIYTSVPTPLVTTNGALITQSATFTFTMGGYNGDVYIGPN